MKSEMTWVTFGEHTETVKTAVHFFPYGGSISATYPVDLTLTIFAEEFETVEVTMEGARLSQPEGIVIDQVFPALLTDYSGLYGLKIKITCNKQLGLDLIGSSCMTELFYPEGVVRFAAKEFDNSMETVTGVCHTNENCSSSLVVLNCSAESQSNHLPAGIVRHKQAQSLEPNAVKEYSVSDNFLQSGIQQNCGLGRATFQSFELSPAAEVVYFTIDREAKTSYPVEVCTL